MSRWYDPGGVASDFWHRVTGFPTAKEKRNQQRAVNDQIKDYKEQSELARSELNQKRASEQAEKRRINEKQIRTLRNNYRAQRFLGTQESTEADMDNKLGG